MTKDIRDEIIKWSINFPYDRAWRKKHNVAYQSLCHREISFLDQVFDIEEDNLFRELSEKEEYIPNIGDWIKPQSQNLLDENSIEALREEFKDIPDD